MENSYQDITVQELMETLQHFDPNDTIRVVDLVKNGKDRYDEFTDQGYKIVWQPTTTPNIRVQRYGLIVDKHLITLKSKTV